MRGMSERDYAAHAGLSRGAIQKAKRTGRLALFADGSIDAAASDARRAETTDPDQQRRSVGEALDWAARILPKRPERRKNLIVNSDGAPVDLAAIDRNGDKALPDRHLREAVGQNRVNRRY